MISVESFSTRSRIAEPDEAISHDELQLATRNHGLPLEGLRYDVTPVGLHYLLVHYDIPLINEADWALEIRGRVDHPVRLDLAELRSMTQRTVRTTLECAGNGRALFEPRPISQPWLVEAVGTADWTGVPLVDLLERTGLRSDATDFVFTGADRGVERGVFQNYQRGLHLADAIAADVIVAHRMNGVSIPPQHGFPVRLVVPGWYGMAHVKWLQSVQVIDTEFDGYQNSVAYRMGHEPGEAGRPVTRIEPRALLVPPGYPDFMSRLRFVDAGPVELMGRAWSGWGRIDRVEISVDGGTEWLPAELADAQGRWAWRSFRCVWAARPGEYLLTARAVDETGRVQPAQADWNRGGFANNSHQRIRTVVLGG